MVSPGRAGQRAQIGAGARLRVAVLPGVRILLDPDQLGAGLDLRVDVGEHLGDAAGARGEQRRLQLHALHDRHDVAFGDLVAAATGMATTIAGAGARTSPASPPEIRCTAPSTSTR